MSNDEKGHKEVSHLKSNVHTFYFHFYIQLC